MSACRSRNSNGEPRSVEVDCMLKPLPTNIAFLLLHGAGHIGILKHLFECTPEFELVKLGKL